MNVVFEILHVHAYDLQTVWKDISAAVEVLNCHISTFHLSLGIQRSGLFWYENRLEGRDVIATQSCKTKRKVLAECQCTKRLAKRFI